MPYSASTLIEVIFLFDEIKLFINLQTFNIIVSWIVGTTVGFYVFSNTSHFLVFVT